MAGLFDILQKFNPFKRNTDPKPVAPPVTTSKVEDTRTPVSFGDQALRNARMIEEINIRGPQSFIPYMMTTEMVITANWLTKDIKNKEGAFECNALAYKQNADDYLHLQTETLHQVLSFYQNFKMMEDIEPINLDDFDLEKIKIGSLSRDLMIMHYQQQKMYDHETADPTALLKQNAIANILELVKNSKGREETFTALYGGEPLFD